MSDFLGIGKFGENEAVKFLENRDYNIIARNFSCKQGEIDIIATKENEIIFCEVKTRSNKKFGEPIDAVDINKQKHILNSAEYYLYKNNLINNYVRFDVLEVYVDGGKVIVNQIKNILG
jgi:putative endonuclease